MDFTVYITKSDGTFTSIDCETEPKAIETAERSIRGARKVEIRNHRMGGYFWSWRQRS